MADVMVVPGTDEELEMIVPFQTRFEEESDDAAWGDGDEEEEWEEEEDDWDEDDDEWSEDDEEWEEEEDEEWEDGEWTEEEE